MPCGRRQPPSRIGRRPRLPQQPSCRPWRAPSRSCDGERRRPRGGADGNLHRGPAKPPKLLNPAPSRRRRMISDFRAARRRTGRAQAPAYMKEAQQHWPFLTNFDASTIKNELQLISIVKDRSGGSRARPRRTFAPGPPTSNSDRAARCWMSLSATQAWACGKMKAARRPSSIRPRCGRSCRPGAAPGRPELSQRCREPGCRSASERSTASARRRRPTILTSISTWGKPVYSLPLLRDTFSIGRRAARRRYPPRGL